MTEILDNPDLLSRAYLDLATLEMGGVALGAPVSDVPRGRVLHADLPAVARYRDGTGPDAEYDAAADRRLTLGEVLDRAAASDGFLYCADGLTYKVRAGTVAGFALHGPQLAHFAHLTSYEEFLAAFGTPDRVREDDAYGDQLTRTAYYWRARKCVVWDAGEHRISLINLGDFEGNSGP